MLTGSSPGGVLGGWVVVMASKAGGFRARSVGPRRAVLIDQGVALGGGETFNFVPVGRVFQCVNKLDGTPIAAGIPDCASLGTAPGITKARQYAARR